jgi:OmpA family protein
MKRTTLLLAGLLSSAALNCHAEGFFIGAEAGLALYPDFTEDARQKSPTTNVTVKQDAASVAYGVYAGYWFTPNFGVEAGWGDLGSVDGTVEGSNFFGTPFKASYSYSAQAATVAALAGFKAGKGTLYGKLGMYSATVDHEFTPGVGQAKQSTSASSTGLLYGAGYSLPFTKSIVGKVELSVYDGVKFPEVFSTTRTTSDNILKVAIGVAYAF